MSTLLSQFQICFRSVQDCFCFLSVSFQLYARPLSQMVLCVLINLKLTSSLCLGARDAVYVDNSTGAKWHTRRKLITPAFHFKILEEFFHIMNDEMAVLMRLLDAKAGGPGFDILPFISHCALDIICSIHH